MLGRRFLPLIVDVPEFGRVSVTPWYVGPVGQLYRSWALSLLVGRRRFASHSDETEEVHAHREGLTVKAGGDVDSQEILKQPIHGDPQFVVTPAGRA